jgi:hypothetical protein
MRVTRIITLLFLLAWNACSHRAPSPIIKLAEDSGAGSLDGVSLPAMRDWLRSHPQVATKLDALCAPLRTNATAAWPETTEGRLCLAARALAGQINAQRQLREHSDHTGFLPGWRRR